MGEELHLERERGAQTRERLTALSLLVDVGVLLVSPERLLDHANPRACELLGCADAAELERRWPEIGELLEPALRLADATPAQSDVEVPAREGARTLRCLAYPLAEERSESTWFYCATALTLDALETDLMLASQLRALSRVYRAVTHDLKAPLNAMTLNLNRLQSALGRGEGAGEAATTGQYLDVLREEIERLDRSLEILLAETTPAGRGREEFDARAMLSGDRAAAGAAGASAARRARVPPTGRGGAHCRSEVSEMPRALQAKLLRALESGAVTRVGGEKMIKVDVRIIAASNRDLHAAAAAGKFREDLLYRLKLFPIRLPALRERAGDVELLAGHFLDELNEREGTRKTLTPAALAILQRYAWPGNVRELKNVIHRAFLLADAAIEPECLPPELTDAKPVGGGLLGITATTPLAEAERRLILAALEHFDGDRRKVAAALGVSLRTLYNRLREYDSG